jgi:single-stranded DNA-specific DHH superfamily exonuclease
MNISDKLLAFDETLAETGDAGARLRNYLLTAERDKGKAHSLAMVLNSVNETARNLTTAAAKAMVIIATELKSLYADYDRNPHELIINWKEIESVSEIPITTRISKTYKKLHSFVTMMHLFINPDDQ